MNVSGRYVGSMTAPAAGRCCLELRIDVDELAEHTPVLGRVSGDLFAARPACAARDGAEAFVFHDSWIVNAPEIQSRPSGVEITGSACFWRAPHQPGSVRIHLDRSDAPVSAEVTVTPPDSEPAIFVCTRDLMAFREVILTVGVCQSVAPLQLPQYEITSHLVHPPGLAPRSMTIERAFADAGIRVVIKAYEEPLDDSSRSIDGWSDAALQDALQRHFVGPSGEWPQWSLWALLARSHRGGHAGLMFDVSAPARRGLAIFSANDWFRYMRDDGAPRQRAQAAARNYLFAWMHEMGHAFNLVHSSDKRRSDALSWMNVPAAFDRRNGAGAFWRAFDFRFDDEELLHLRHGHRPSVIMGGATWSADRRLSGDSEAIHPAEAGLHVM